MGRLQLSIDDKIEAKFRKKLFSEGKFRKGEISKKIEEMMMEWLK